MNAVAAARLLVASVLLAGLAGGCARRPPAPGAPPVVAAPGEPMVEAPAGAGDVGGVLEGEPLPEPTPPPSSDPQDCARAERLTRHAARLHDPGERTHVLERAEALCPDDPDLLAALASAYRDGGEPELAASVARRALAIDPNHRGASRLLDALTR